MPILFPDGAFAMKKLRTAGEVPPSVPKAQLHGVQWLTDENHLAGAAIGMR